MYRHLSIVGHLQLRRILGALSQPTPASSDHRRKKRFLRFFYFGHVLTFLMLFIFQTLFI